MKKYFCVVYDHVGKADLSKGYWNPKRKLGVITHFLEIIKQQLFLKTVKYKAVYGIIIFLNCVVPENIHTPPTEDIFILTPHPLGISVPEGLWWPPHPSGISRFLEPSSMKPSEVQNPFRLRKLTTHTITINFFIIEAASTTLVQLFTTLHYFYLFILLLKLYPEKIG